MKRLSRVLFAATALFAAVNVQATARDYSFAVFVDPGNYHALAFKDWADTIKQRTNGDVAVEIYYSGSLVPAREVLKGTRDGLSDIGMQAVTYIPSELPLWNILPDLSFRYPDAMVAAFANTEYGILNEQGAGEFRRNGVIFLGGYSTTTYHFICNKTDIGSVEALAGTRVRAPGGVWSRFVRSIGMLDVSLPAGEMYMAFERGLVDCTSADWTVMTVGPTLMGVTKAVNTMPLPPFAAGASWLFNPDSWASISPENRKIIFEESADAVALAVAGWYVGAEASQKKSLEAGIKLVEPTPGLIAAREKFTQGLDAEMIAAGKAAGVENIEKAVADMSALMEKWTKLLDGVDRTDNEKLGKILYDEVYSKLDPNTFGNK